MISIIANNPDFFPNSRTPSLILVILRGAVICFFLFMKFGVPYFELDEYDWDAFLEWFAFLSVFVFYPVITFVMPFTDTITLEN